MTKITRESPQVPQPATRATAAEQPSAQAPTVRTRKTSVLPGALRNLMDTVTARPQINEAKRLDNDKLETLLNRQDLPRGRSVRAIQREARRRGLLPGQPQTPTQGAQPTASVHAPVGDFPGAGPTAHESAVPSDGGSAEIPPADEPPVTAASAGTSEIPPADEPPVAAASAGTSEITPADEALVRTPRTTLAAPDAPAAIAPPDGPVIDPDTGALDKPRLRQTIHAFIDALPPLPDHIAIPHPTSDLLRNRLIKELHAIDTLAADDTRLRPDQLGLALRDTFAKASRTAKVLARYLDRAHVAGDAARPDTLTYALLAGLLTELKRTHLSAAAADIADEYARREVENLERAAPGISQQVSGPNVSTTTAASLAYAPLHTHSAVTTQAGASASRTLYADDDRDIDFWTSYGISLKAGIGGKLRQLANWGGQASGQFSYSGGDVYFEHDNLHELVKLIGNLDANRSWIRSAGPKTRKLVHNWEQLRNDVARFVGRNYTPTAGRPYYLNDRKIEKGVNAMKATVLSMALDAHLGHHRFGTLIGAAYPSAGDLLRQRLADEAPLPVPPRRDVPDSVAYADRLVGFREATVIGDANLSNGTDGGTDLEAAGTFDASLKGDLMEFFLETANAPHQLLDPGYHKDFKATFALHRQLDALCGSPPPPMLHLYDTMRRRLSGASTDTAAPTFAERDQLLYGDAAAVPAQFRQALAQPAPQQLEHAAAQAERLTATYRGFVDDSMALLAQNDRFMPRAQRADLHSARVEAFARINDEIWGGRYPHSEAHALANPQEFVACSHANISLALGCIGTHIALVKQQMAAHADPAHMAAIQHADTRYDTARKLLDRIYLPLKKYDVQKNGPLKDKSVWRRWDAALKLQASGGAEANTLGAVLRRWGKSLSPFSISNNTGDATISAEVKVLKATHQVNPSRIGTFWQITLSAQAGAPLLGSALERAVSKAVERLNASLATDAPKIDPAEAIRQVQGLALDISDGSAIVMKFRQAPGSSARATDLQYVRVLSSKSSGVAVSASLPTHVGTFTPAAAFTDSSQGFEGEIIGPDLSYLMMQHPKLAGLLEQENHDDPNSLKQLFDANPRVRNGYFGHPQTLVEVVSRYADYLRARDAAAAQGESLENAPMVNEFQRYYASAPFSRVAQIARQVAAHAPGTTAGGAPPVEAPPLGTDIEVGHVDLDAARRHLGTLSTIDERTAYFCGEGRALLDAFAAIVGNTRAINSAAMFHVESRNTGFQTDVRDEAQLSRHNERLTAARDGATVSGIGERLGRVLQPYQTAVRELPLQEVERLAELPSSMQAAAQDELRRRNALLEGGAAQP